MKKYILIEHDPFFICQRLKEIDKSYFVLFNKTSKKYEVHSSEQIDNTYCFTVRFNDLDERTIQYALKTRKERQVEFIKALDEENEKLLKSQVNNAVEKLMEVAV